jgi:hypothetical protein
LSASAALNAFHVESATMATPGVRPSIPSSTNASRTPGGFLISSTFALTTLPPNVGHFVYVAYNIPGQLDVDAEERRAGHDLLIV